MFNPNKRTQRQVLVQLLKMVVEGQRLEGNVSSRNNLEINVQQYGRPMDYLLTCYETMESISLVYKAMHKETIQGFFQNQVTDPAPCTGSMLEGCHD